MNLKLNCILIIAFLLFYKGYSQNKVNGFIVDTNSKPIEYANVVLTDSITNKVVNGTVTNSKGEFEIVNVENCQCKLKISFVGFEKLVLSLSINNSLNLGEIVLKSSSNKLDEVTINAKVPIIRLREDKIVFDVKNSPLKTGYSGIEVLEQSPSIWVNESNDITIRNEVARILINGRKLNMPGDAIKSYLLNIRSEDIIEIEIQTNKDASREAESTGGVINIILNRKPIGFNGSLAASYSLKGEGGFVNYDRFNFNYGEQNWNVYGSFSYFLNSSFDKSLTSISYFETNNFLETKKTSDFRTDLYRYTVGFVSNLSKNHEIGLELFGNLMERRSNEPGLFFFRDDLNLIDNGTVLNVDDSYSNVFNGVLNYTWKINKTSDFKFYIDFLKNDYDNTNDFDSTYELGFFDNVSEKNLAENGAEVIAFQTDYKKNFNHGFKLESGLKFTSTDRLNSFTSNFLANDVYVLNEDRTTSFNYKEKVTAGYISLGKKIKDKNYLKVGLRVENTDLAREDLLDNDIIKQNYTNLFPSIFYSREFSKNKSLSLSYSKSIRRPSFTLLNNDVVKVNDFRFTLGNPDLQPEFIDKLELSFLYKKQSFALYYNKTNDAINGIYTLEDEIAFYQKINSGSQVQYGIDYNRSDKWNKWWSTRFSSNFYNRKFINEFGEDNFEQFTVNLRMFNTLKINNRTRITLAGIYNSPRKDAFYKSFENYRVNLGFRKSYLKKRLDFRIDIIDLFNTSEFRSLREFDNYSTTYKFKRQTRFIRFWLTYNFSNKYKTNKKRNKSKNDARKRL